MSQATFLDPNPEVNNKTFYSNKTYIEKDKESKTRKAQEPLHPSQFKKSN